MKEKAVFFAPLIAGSILGFLLSSYAINQEEPIKADYVIRMHDEELSNALKFESIKPHLDSDLRKSSERVEIDNDKLKELSEAYFKISERELERAERDMKQLSSLYSEKEIKRIIGKQESYSTEPLVIKLVDSLTKKEILTHTTIVGDPIYQVEDYTKYGMHIPIEPSSTSSFIKDKSLGLNVYLNMSDTYYVNKDNKEAEATNLEIRVIKLGNDKEEAYEFGFDSIVKIPGRPHDGEKTTSLQKISPRYMIKMERG